MNERFENLGKARGLASMIVDLFEDLLAEYNILIPNDEREGEEDEACIYGDDYYTLEDQITELLCEHIEELNEEE
jgi:hypothetical protein